MGGSCLASTQSCSPRREAAEWRRTARRPSLTSKKSAQKARSPSKPSRRSKASEAAGQRYCICYSSEILLTHKVKQRSHRFNQNGVGKSQGKVFPQAEVKVSGPDKPLPSSVKGHRQRQRLSSNVCHGRWTRRWIHYPVNQELISGTEGR